MIDEPTADVQRSTPAASRWSWSTRSSGSEADVIQLSRRNEMTTAIIGIGSIRGTVAARSELAAQRRAI